MPNTPPPRCPLPLPLPKDHAQRLTLRCLRRMAAHGVHDAQAALWMFEGFGLHFRRPLVLLRAFVIELAQVSRRRIQLAPYCAMRMTADESRIVALLADPATASRHLPDLTGGAEANSPLSLAIAYSEYLPAAARLDQL